MLPKTVCNVLWIISYIQIEAYRHVHNVTERYPTHLGVTECVGLTGSDCVSKTEECCEIQVRDGCKLKLVHRSDQRSTENETLMRMNVDPHLVTQKQTRLMSSLYPFQIQLICIFIK